MIWIFCIVKYPEIFQPIMNLLQKLSGFAKTFRTALLTRWRGFWDSAPLFHPLDRWPIMNKVRNQLLEIMSMIRPNHTLVLVLLSFLWTCEPREDNFLQAKFREDDFDGELKCTAWTWECFRVHHHHNPQSCLVAGAARLPLPARRSTGGDRTRAYPRVQQVEQVSSAVVWWKACIPILLVVKVKTVKLLPAQKK